jgi:hypothetical protein
VVTQTASGKVSAKAKARFGSSSRKRIRIVEELEFALIVPLDLILRENWERANEKIPAEFAGIEIKMTIARETDRMS